MTDRQLLKLAARELDPDHLAVWLQKHHQNTGRRAGARFLGITQEQWRWRLQRAERILAKALEQENAA